MCKEINNLNDFKEWAKTVTRDVFIDNLRNRGLYLDDKLFIGCPTRIGISTTCSLSKLCKDCWIDSAKDIQFKDDLEKQSNNTNTYSYHINKNDNDILDYDKEYNILEVFEFPNDTKFDFRGYPVKPIDSVLYLCNNIELDTWEESKWITKKEYMYGYKLIKQDTIKQITFADIYKLENKDNLFMVEHDLIKDGIFMEDELEYLFSYESLDVLLNKLTNVVDYKELIEVINNGKWTMKVMNG